MEPQKSRWSIRRIVLLLTLVSATGALTVVSATIPNYWEHGAWRGYYDQPGEPSPVDFDENRVWLVDSDGERTFDITDSDLRRSHLRSAGSRFGGPTVVDPYYEEGDPAVLRNSTESWMQGIDRTLVIKIGDDVRAIPVGLVQTDMVVNDVIGGVPVLIVVSKRIGMYAVFEREYASRVHTFGSSGYLYYENSVWDGNFGILLWDFETHSLWWPQKGVAVSGMMQGTPMKMLDSGMWSQTHWNEIVETFDSIKIVRDGHQTREDDPAWERYHDAPQSIEGTLPNVTRWGDNETLLK